MHHHLTPDGYDPGPTPRIDTDLKSSTGYQSNHRLIIRVTKTNVAELGTKEVGKKMAVPAPWT